MDKIKRIVHETVLEMLAVERTPKDCYRATESRLYAYPTLMANIERYKLDIADLKREGITARSRDITSWGGASVRLTPEEKQQARILSVENKLSRDSAEVAAIDGCLERLEADDKLFVRKVFFSAQTPEQFDMPVATFQRRRGRLLRQIAAMLYGADSLG